MRVGPLMSHLLTKRSSAHAAASCCSPAELAVITPVAANNT